MLAIATISQYLPKSRSLCLPIIGALCARELVS